MSRRVSLPGADELFRTTGGMALQSSSPRRGVEESAGGSAQSEHPANSAEGTTEGRGRETGEPAVGAQRRPQEGSATAAAGASAPRRGKGQGRGANRRPSGRERHDEKITVYVSAEELMDLEHARLVLRGEHGLAVDRGRIVREAVAVVLADLESRGDASILVRRLRGR
ncbi:MULTISPECIES: hypothetical protein [unclassified Streptomyces]|uniref:hypothetical protein n=1 Tax=unclassified Streptomyces TaxID=2593676 RepID=UPI00227212DD|nr:MULTISPECIES: hypothetical protein [unclassified Streptomyces]MCY0922036.1 hypothetical protein [Streptomyces sp. H27-G5]MCY0961390.1 hypothetical protein [Streptomyces sp. H27-H5]